MPPIAGDIQPADGVTPPSDNMGDDSPIDPDDPIPYDSDGPPPMMLNQNHPIETRSNLAVGGQGSNLVNGRQNSPEMPPPPPPLPMKPDGLTMTDNRPLGMERLVMEPSPSGSMPGGKPMMGELVMPPEQPSLQNYFL